MTPENEKAHKKFMAQNVTLELSREEVTVVLLALKSQHAVGMEYAKKCRAMAEEWRNTPGMEDDELRLAAAFEKDAADLAAVYRKIAGYDMPTEIR